MQKIIAKKYISDADAELLKGKFLDESCYDTLITEDTDAHDEYGNMLFKFRKNAIGLDVLKQGYESFKDSITLTEGRGISSGSSHKRIRKDGSVSNITVGNKVYSGNVGYMDASAMVHYCRKTAFARQYFDKFTQGIPFVQAVDKLYAELCPEHYARQKKIASATDLNYVIAGTSFTTVTVNRNFQTAVHKDAGDLPDGFGNLCVYREGYFEGAYFCLPQYRVAIDMQNTDMLFVDVHRWHGNTPFVNCSADFMRIAFVMYYREDMYQCKKPSDELHAIKMKETGYRTL
jgi:hypothetical protein